MKRTPLSSTVGTEGGNPVAAFVVLKAKEDAIWPAVAALDVKELARLPLLSVNAKTTASLDFPIGHTCTPTALCALYCYAVVRGSTATWPQCIRKRLRNLRYVEITDPHEVAARLSNEFASKRKSWKKNRGVTLDYLRFNGTGDLFPAVIPVINAFAAMNPDVAVWVVTRKFNLASGIAPLPNIFLQLSLDATTPPALRDMAGDLVASHPRAYLSFLRTKPDDDTQGAAIVFNEKRTKGLPYKSRTDCPVDAGKLDLGNIRGVGGTACSTCRKCFTDLVLTRQRAELATRLVEAPGTLVQLRLKNPPGVGAEGGQ